jgi:hypothetical protein
LIDASEEDIFSYKSQRWLWNEETQLQRRYLKFDLNALSRVAEDALSPPAKCTEITKLPEGNFNKTLLLEMHDGRQVVAKLPNPNAGRPKYTIASEVATMDYVHSLSPSCETLLICRKGQTLSSDSRTEDPRLPHPSKQQ